MDPTASATAYSIMDSSRVSTFFISILLIVYGSFRSLAMEEGKGEEGEEKEKKESNVTTLDSLQAMCLPLGASVSLLIMFFFFDSMQLLFAVCTAVIATVALAFLLLPMCQYLVRPCTTKGKICMGLCVAFIAFVRLPSLKVSTLLLSGLLLYDVFR